MYTIDQLVVLARAYVAATGVALSTVSLRAVPGNDRFFGGLIAGRDCSARNAERAGNWFDENWPDTVPWPKEVPRRRLLPKEITRHGVTYTRV